MRLGIDLGGTKTEIIALDDAGGGQLHVKLRAGAVDDDGRQADVLQEGQRGDQRIEVVAQDRAARLFLYRGEMDKEWAAYGPDAKAYTDAFVAGMQGSGIAVMLPNKGEAFTV